MTTAGYVEYDAPSRRFSLPRGPRLAARCRVSFLVNSLHDVFRPKRACTKLAHKIGSRLRRLIIIANPFRLLIAMRTHKSVRIQERLQCLTHLVVICDTRPSACPFCSNLQLAGVVLTREMPFELLGEPFSRHLPPTSAGLMRSLFAKSIFPIPAEVP